MSQKNLETLWKLKAKEDGSQGKVQQCKGMRIVLGYTDKNMADMSNRT